MSGIDLLKKASALHIVILGLLLVALTGWVDFVTGWQANFVVFYLLPITFVAWHAGRYASIVTVLLSAISVYWAEVLWDIPYTNPFIPFWNASTRFLIFLLIAYLVAKLKHQVVTLEEIVAERTANLRDEIAGHIKTENTLDATNKTLLIYQNQLESLAAELSMTEERERRQIASDLHDQLGQNLALARLKISTINFRDSVKDANTVKVVGALLDEAIQNIRTMTFEISPPLLYEIGLEAALEWLGENMQHKYGLMVDINSNGAIRPLSDQISTTLYSVIRELLINISKHARTGHASLFLQENGEFLQIEVKDAGAGFDIEADRNDQKRHDGFGLFSVRQRMAYLGGKMTTESADGHGTRVVLQIPLGNERHSPI